MIKPLIQLKTINEAITPMILNILPYKEAYNKNNFGAIALAVQGFKEASFLKKHIYIIGSKSCDDALTANYDTVHFKKKFWQSATKVYLKKCLEYLQNKKCQLIEIHNRPIWIEQLNQVNIPLSLFLHNDPQEMKGFETPAKRLEVLKKCAHVLCISKFIKKRLVEGIPAKEPSLSKIKVVYNYIKPQIAKTPKKEKIIIFVGRLTQEKGIIELTEALGQLLPKYKAWKAIIIGSPSNIQISDKSPHAVEALAKKYPTQIIHIPQCEHKKTMKWFEKSAIAVLPSKWQEPFGRTVLEAISSGCATITTNRGGIPEIVGDAAILLDEVNSEHIAFQLNKVLSNINLQKQYQKKALQQAKNFYEEHNSISLLDKIRKQYIVS